MAQRKSQYAQSAPIVKAAVKAGTRQARNVQHPPGEVENARAGGVRPTPGESRIQAPDESTWNDLADSEERPMSNNKDMKEVATGEDKESKIRALLRRPASEVTAAEVAEAADGSTEEVTEATEEPGTTEEPAEVAETPPARREMFDKVDAEAKRVSLERQLREANAARKAAEDAIKTGDLASIMKARGITKDQAIDLILSDPNATAAPAATVDPIDARLTKIEERERAAMRREAVVVVGEHTKDLKIPVTRATKAVTVVDGDGRQRIMSGMELIVATAQRLHQMDGSPPHRAPNSYLKEAALATEQQLIADQKEAFEAYAEEHRGAPKPTPGEGGAPKPRTTSKAPPTGLGRTGGGTGATKKDDIRLPEDQDDRQKAIKARFGWR